MEESVSWKSGSRERERGAGELIARWDKMRRCAGENGKEGIGENQEWEKSGKQESGMGMII